MSQVQPEQPSDPFNTEGLVAPPRDDPAAPRVKPAIPGAPTQSQAQPQAAGPGQASQVSSAGTVQPMTNLLGIPDPVPTPVTPIADAAHSPVQPVEPSGSGQDAQPVRVTSAVGGAPPLLAPIQDQIPPKGPAQAINGVESVSQVPSPIVEGGAMKIGGGQPLGQPAGPVQTPPAEPSPAPANPKADSPDAPDDPEDPMTPSPRPGHPPIDAPPIPTPAQAAQPSTSPSGAADKGGKTTTESDKALQDDFAKHWQGGKGDKQDGQADEEEADSEEVKGAGGKDVNARPGPTGAVTTTWTSPDGETHTGIETPRGAGTKSVSSTSGGKASSANTTTSTSAGTKKAEETRAAGEQDKLEEEGKDDTPDAKTDESRDPPSSQADQSTPTSHDNTPSSTFPIDPASSYTVVTGTVTLTGEAAVSAIKAGATPLDAQGATETKEKDKEGGPGTVVIAGIVGGVVVLLLLGCWVWYRIRKRKANTEGDDEKSPSTPYTSSGPSRGTPRGPHSGSRGHDTDWTDSGFDFIDDPISATSTQIRNRRSTIANYYHHHGMPPPHPSHHARGAHGARDPFDDMNAREYAQAYGAGQGRGGMEVMYDEKGHSPGAAGYTAGYGQHGVEYGQQHQMMFDPANPPQVGQLWRTEDPFTDQGRTQGINEHDHRYDGERERGPSPLQDLPLSPPPEFASPSRCVPDTGFSARLTNPFGEPTPAQSHDYHHQPSMPHAQENTPCHIGYESRAGTQYGNTALYDTYERHNTTGVPDTQDHSGAYGLPLETGLPAKTPATGSLLPWLGADSTSKGSKSSKSKDKKHKKVKSKDKKRSKSSKGYDQSPQEVEAQAGYGDGMDDRHLQTPYPHLQQSHTTEARRYDLVDPSNLVGYASTNTRQDDPFDDMEEVPHPVRAAMAATPAVAKMQMTQRNVHEVPIPNFR